MLGNLSVFPGRIAALRELKRLAEQRDRVPVALLCHELKLYSWPREKMPIAFLGHRAPVVAAHFLASDGEVPPRVGSDAHCQGMLARLARRTASANDAAYCRQYPNLVRFVLGVSCSFGPVAPLPS
jgi:hypothetical protein